MRFNPGLAEEKWIYILTLEQVCKLVKEYLEKEGFKVEEEILLDQYGNFSTRVRSNRYQ